MGSVRYNDIGRVMALSLGTIIAVAWSKQHPSEIERLVLINTSLAPYNLFYQRLRPSNYPALILHLLFGSAVQRESLILQHTSSLKSRSEHKQAILDQWTSYAQECPITRANVLRQLRAAIRLLPAAGHNLSLDDGVWVTQQVKEWLNS